MNTIFTLHPKLEAESSFITDLDLCRLLLINDSHYPWTVLVPMINDATEIYKLDSDDQTLLWRESALLCKTMDELFKPDKMNVAAIGNMVPQLHLHHVARIRTDQAWPAPVWGYAQASPYTPELNQKRVTMIKEELQSQRLQ